MGRFQIHDVLNENLQQPGFLRLSDIPDRLSDSLQKAAS